MGNKPQTLLGFAVPSGEPVSVPLHHMVVCGLTQMSGKTTTLEALIERSGLTAIVFRSKRGEAGFETAAQLAPYFREQFDWEYVQDLLEASLQERMKFERSWIIEACKGARSLDQVHANVRKSLEKARGLSRSVYTNLNAYFEKILPELLPLRRADFARLWTLADGLAWRAEKERRRLFVMDISAFRLEVQSLIVRSTISDISEGTLPTVIVLPEAWKFLPQSRGNPAKRAAERLVREGAASGKFLWIDTQDITGCDKTILKSIDVWLLGRQRERNEIRRMLDQIPAATKPKPEDIATLPLGQFFACFGRQVVRTYVMPAWADPDAARRCAKGEIPPPARPAKPQEPPMQEVSRPVDQDTADLIDSLQRQTDLIHSLERQVEELELENKKLRAAAAAAPGPGHVEIGRIHGPGTGLDDGPPLLRTGTVSRAARSDAKSRAAADGQDDLVQAVLDRLRGDPQLLAVVCVQKEISVAVAPVRIDLDGSSLRGRICRLIAAGFLDEPRTGNTIFNELKRTGARIAKPNVYRECKQLAEWGFLTIEAGGGYAAVPQMKRHIEER